MSTSPATASPQRPFLSKCVAVLAVGLLIPAWITTTPTPAHAATILVTASGDQGAGTLGAAIAEANGSQGPDTITIAAGLLAEVTESFEVTETVTIVGEPGSQIVNKPNYRGAVLAATGGATINLEGVTFAGSNAYGGLVSIASTTEATSFTDVTVAGVELGREADDFFSFEDARGPITLTNCSFTGRSSSPTEALSVLRAERLAAPLTVIDSNFEEIATSAISVGAAELPADASITVSDSRFQYVAAAQPYTRPGTVLHVDGGSAQAAERSAPAVNISNTYIDASRNSVAGSLYFQDLVGDVIITNSSIIEGGSAGENAAIAAVGHLGQLAIEGVTFAQITGTNGTARSIGFGAAASAGDGESGVTVVNSTFDAPNNFDRKPHIALHGNAGASINHATFIGGGVQATDPTATAPIELVNSIVGVGAQAGGAENEPVEAVFGERVGPVTGTHNTVNALGTLAASGNDVVADGAAMKLLPLADNGGSTLTILPETGSPVIDSAVASAPATEQRGFARTFGSAPDRGAVEVRGGTVSLGDDVTVNAGVKAGIPVTYTPGEDDTGATVRIDILSELAGEPGTATAGQDFHPLPLYTSLTFAAGGPSTKIFEVPTYVYSKGFDPLTFFASITETSSGIEIADPADLTVYIVTALPAPPTVTDPKDVTVDEGTAAEFTVTTTGEPAPKVTWEVSRDGGKTWVAVDASWKVSADGNTSTLTVPGALANDGFEFRATAVDAGGQAATSAGAKLTVEAATSVGPGPGPGPGPNPGPNPDPNDGNVPAVKPVEAGLAATGTATPGVGVIALIITALGLAVLLGAGIAGVGVAGAGRMRRSV